MLLADPVVVIFQVLSLLLALPGFLFACACLVLKRAIGRGSLWGFIDTILHFLVVMLPWGIYALGILLFLLVMAGCSARWNHPVSGVILATAVGSAVVMYSIAKLRDRDQVWFYVPGGLSVLISGWLFFVTR